ncbi:CC1-like splicing factor [Chloropicon primus]|uniref:CC1-like splicing factor n=1 Tax=Chloropicon primus TaxID=1764295 RepID=A0A5B8MGM4_9CHLO|nr:CC1-like splicing factor [Chloropicon primus]|eukprot:QDZ18825.1 CC1-like splicing factor [Chloropicon primus]
MEVEEPEPGREERGRRSGRSLSPSTEERRSRGRRKRSRSRERERRRDRRSRSRSGERERYGGGRRYNRDSRDSRRRSGRRERDRRERTPPEVMEERERERDSRTVFVNGLSAKCGDRDLFDFFSDSGTVVDIRIIRDRYTRRCKGYAYVEFEDKSTVDKSLLLSGSALLGSSVEVRSTSWSKEGERGGRSGSGANAGVQRAHGSSRGDLGAEGAPSPTGRMLLKLYVGNLHPGVTPQDLKSIFEPFGPVAFANLAQKPQAQDPGRAWGYGFVQFANQEDGSKAAAQLDGLELAGLSIKVSAAKSNAEVGQDAAAPGQASLDDDLTGSEGLKLNAKSRMALMAKLSGGSEAAVISQVGAGGAPAPADPAPGAGGPSSAEASDLEIQQGVLGPASPIPTVCILLKNMFDPKEETEEGWDEDIADDVKQECSNFGRVKHIFVDKESQGFAYLKLETVEAAKRARSSLHARWFAGRRIACDFQFLQVYDKHFGL